MRALVLSAALIACACVPQQRLGQVERYSMLQLRVPRLPGEPAVVELTTPSGASLRVDSWDEGDDTFVRLGPRETGAYRFVVRRGDTDVLRGDFEAVASSRVGPVRRDPHESHRLVRDDGTTFFMLGENRINIYDSSWNIEGLNGPEYVARMASYGMTTLRMFIFTDIECEECAGGVQLGALEPELGHYDPEVARRFDAIVKAAEEHDVQVIITLFAIGFTEGETWKSWHDNPYSKERGGPAATPHDFFSNEQARVYALGRLRYVLARWGYSTHLLAIDLLNEPEWDGPIPEGEWIPWARELSRDAGTHEGRDHLITAGPVGLSSNVGSDDERAWYPSKENDIVQWHLYGEPFYEPVKLAAEMTRRVREAWDYDRPVLCGEFGYGGEDQATHEHTHVGIWSGIFSGGGVLSHTAPVFNVDVSGARLVDTEVTAGRDGLHVVSPAFSHHVAARYVRL